MPAEIPQTFPEPDRNELRDQYLRDVAFYSDGAQDVGDGSQPWIDGSVLADQLVPAYLRIKTSGENLVLTKSTSAATESWAASKGQTERIGAIGASGYVQISASTGGTTIFAGDELRETSTGLRFQVSETGTYADEDVVPVTGLDTGTATNLDPGTVLTWTSPRPGCGSTATVWEDADGSGLSGGRAEETDAEVIARLIEAGRNPPASGNDAQYQALVKATPGLAVQQGFTYPAILGPGTVGIAFTLQPAIPGGDRIPNAAQMTLVENWLQSQVPHDDQFFVCTLTSEPVDVAMEVQWQEGADDWTDTVPWPPYYSGTSAIKVTAVTSATYFTLGRASGNYSGAQQPIAGQTIAFFDASNRTFSKKRILSFTGTGPWVITVDPTNNVSDLTFTPAVGDRAMPHSPSLELVLDPVLSYFDTLGPGEQVASFFDAGYRQRRTPAPPKSWPSTVGARLINGVQDLAAVADASLQEPTTPLACPVGTAATESYLHQLRGLAVFALT